MCKNYLDVFNKLIENRDEILKNRRLPKITFWTKLKYKLNLKFLMKSIIGAGFLVFQLQLRLKKISKFLSFYI